MEGLQVPGRFVHIAVGLVNTRTRSPEQLVVPEDFRRFLLEHGEPEPIEVSEQDLVEVRAVRERIRPVFEADPSKAAAVLNGLLSQYAVQPYLSDHDGTPWHLHVAPPDASWAEWLAAGTALGLAGFVGGRGFGAIGVCAAADCERVYANLAERRPKKYCSPTCSGRTRVASYRARRQA